MLLSGSWFGAIKTDQGHFPWHPPRYALSGTFKGQSEQKSAGRKKKKTQTPLTSWSSLHVSHAVHKLWRGAELWAKNAQHAYSNDASKPHHVRLFITAFYLASAVGTDAKSKYYPIIVALSVGMAFLSGKKVPTLISFLIYNLHLHLYCVFRYHGQGWDFQFRCTLFICIIHTLGGPTLTVTDNKWRSKTLTLYENVQRLWKDTSGCP